MAAAPTALDERPIASPELALVDSTLATRLRSELPVPGDARERLASERTVRAPVLELVVDSPDVSLEEEAPPEREHEVAVDGVDDLLVLPEASGPDDPGAPTADDLAAVSAVLVSTEDDSPVHEPADDTGYPSLPVPGRDVASTEETDAVLRGIQRRLTQEPQPKARRTFRRYTIGSAVLAFGAILAYAAQLYVGLLG
jgi:hypothetical protein